MSLRTLSYTKFSTDTVQDGQGYVPHVTVGDPYWNQVSCLLLGDGIINNQSNGTFIDSSTNNLAITPTGTPTQTPFNPFSANASSGSLYFNGSSDYINAPSSSVLTFGSSPFTVEFWFYPTTASATMVDMRNAAPVTGQLVVNTNASNQVGVFIDTYLVASMAATAIPLNAWTHLAVVRSANTVTLYINGVSAGSGTYATALATSGIRLGADYGGVGKAQGYMSNFRVVNGTALYTSNFIPSASPLTVITNTSLLLSGTNFGVTDSSVSNNPVITGGAAKISTVQKKYGSGSLALTTSTATDYLKIPTNYSAFAFGTSDFTIECWVYPTQSFGTSNFLYGRASGTTAATTDIEFLINSSGQVQASWFTGATTVTFTTSLTVALTTWTHIAWTRTSGVSKVYINGVADTGSSTNAGANNDTASAPFIGNRYTGILGFVGYIDDFRVTRASRYSSNFIVPQQGSYTTYLAPYYDQYIYNSTVSTMGDPYWQSVNLLLRGLGVSSMGNNTFLDSSSNNLAIAKVGTPTQGAFTPFLPLFSSQYSLAANGGSIYLNGTTDYLTAADSTGLQFGTSDFTIEFWVYCTATPATSSSVLTKLGTTTGFGAFNIYFGASGVPKMVISSNGVSFDIAAGVGSTAISTGVWNHIALTRQTNTFTLWVNGTSSGSATSASGVTSSSGVPVTLGACADGTGKFSGGYFSNIRIVKGTAVYTSAFTPSSVPLKVIAGTSLLLSGTNFSIGDTACQNDVITAGSASISTSKQKYSGGSLAFNGTTDYLVVPNSANVQLGAGDFTIEVWVCLNSVTSNQAVFAKESSGASSLVLYMSGATPTVAISTNGSTYTVNSGGGTLAIGVWAHLALVRQGANTTLFVNGISVYTSAALSTTSIFNDASSFTVAYRNSSTPWFLSGYMDDLRITKGFARYLGNFTPPLAQLPNYYQALAYDPYFPQVSLLMHGDGVNLANNSTILDSGVNNFTITKGGTPAQGSFSPFPPIANTSGFTYAANGGSIFFNGSTDYLLIASSAPVIGTNDFTFEVWVYPTSVAATNKAIYGWRNGADTSPYVFLNSSNVPQFGGDITNYLVSSTAVTVNAWNHIACTRAGTGSNNMKMYLNGVQVATGTSNQNFSYSGGVDIGVLNGGNPYYFSGYMSNLRIVVGTAVYTAAFTPPTSPLAGPSDLFASSVITQLSGEGANASTTIIDAVASNVDTATTGAVLTSAIAKYGTSSISLNSGAVTLGGAFTTNLKAFTVSPITMEAWVYPTSNAQAANIFSNYAGLTAPGMWRLNMAASTGNLGFTWSTGAAAVNNNTVLDSSTNAFTILRNGTPTQGTFTPFRSGWSAYFNGSTDYIAMLSNAALNAGTGDWTVECWVNIATLSNTPVVFDTRNLSGGGGWALSISTVGVLSLYGGATLATLLVTGSVTVSSNSWTHIAVVRSSGTTTLYVNGASVGSASDATNYSITSGITIGKNGAAASNYLSGYVSNFRWVTGTAIYTGAFTPPTSPLVAVTNTAILTLQSPRFLDNSVNAFTVYPAGSPSAQPWSPFAAASAYAPATNGGSIYFNGVADYVAGTSGFTAANFGTNDYTVEGWIYPTSLTSSLGKIIIDNRPDSTNGNYWILSITSAGNLAFTPSTSPSVSVTASAVVPLNQWTHVAVTRVGTALKVFQNGAVVATLTDSTSMSTNVSLIGASAFRSGAPDSYFQGYMSGLRYVKGTAIYTATFTPPTAPVTAITGTSLLLSGVNTGVVDGTGVNDIVTVGSVAVQSTVVKYGTGAISFNGTTDYLSMPARPALNLTLGNWTIECWVYFTNVVTNTSANIWNKDGVVGSSFSQHGLALNGAGKFIVSVGNGNGLAPTDTFYTGTTTIAAGQWYHTAVVMSGTTLTFYLNGVPEASGTQTVTMVDGGKPLLVGYQTAQGAASYFAGYIDDLRITKGVARYTSSFTPPTAALPNSAAGDVYFSYNTLLLQGDIVQPVSSVSSAMSPALNNWSHVALVVDSTPPASSTIRLFVNGTMQAFTGNNLTSQSTQYTAPRIGTDADGNNPLMGYIDEVRITEAVRYVTTFRPLSSAMNTNLGVTSLLLSGTNGAIYDSAAKNNLDVRGTTNLNVSVNKFGGSSIAFNGTTDYIAVPNSTQLDLSTGNWTVEFWMYASAIVSGASIVGKMFAGSPNAGPFYIGLSSGTLVFYSATGSASWDVISGTVIGSVSTNTWYHVAVVRNGSTFTGYLNGEGTALGTSAVTLAVNTSPVLVGAANGAVINGYFSGYIDDLRITKGAARYNGNFTPAPNAFPNY